MPGIDNQGCQAEVVDEESNPTISVSSEDDSSFNSLFANSESEYPIVARDGSIDVAVPEPNGQIEPAFEPSLPEIGPGTKIFYWIPGRVCGVAESAMYAQILTVFEPERYMETNVPFELDSGHILYLDTEIRVVAPICSIGMIRIDKFVLTPGTVQGPAAYILSDNLRQHIETLKKNNPGYEDFFRVI
uniref:Uncharacterized protein n=1 Tax=Spongospora subterranea TaxID=70186 RepID=A0A0H5R1M4_9EUKA|eukprot:CRZ08138.1 hypothetical protein [Spongospora subterranea]